LSSFPRNIALAGLVSIALVLGVVSPANATGQVPPPPVVPKSEPVSSVPPLPVPTAKVSGPSSKPTGAGAPAADLVAVPPKPAVKFAAPSDKSAFDPKTSVPVSYGTNDTIFKNSDGSETKEISPTPLNVQKSDGSWTAASTSIAQNVTTGGFAVADNPLNPTFAKTLAAGPDFSVNSGSDPVSVSLIGAAAVNAVRPSASALHSSEEGLGSNSAVAGSSALEYPNALPGQDLQYQVTTSEVKETLVLNTVPAASETSWSWIVHAPGLTMSQSNMGSLYLTDARGTVQYNIPDPVMWDSAGVAGQSEAALVDVPFTFAQNAAGDWVITLTPDRAWLTDPSRVFPVSIDPTLGSGPTGVESYESNGVTYAGQGRMGNPRVSSKNTYWRTVACYAYSSLVPGQEITGGYMAYGYVAGYAATEPGYIYYATTYSYNGVGQYISSWDVTNGGGNTTDAGIPNQYQAWDNQGVTGTCLLLVGNEVGSYTYKDVNTALYLGYQAAPTAVPVSPSPANGGRGATMPTLAVSSNDPSGVAQNFTFNVSTNSNPATSPVYSTTTSGTTTASLQVPKGVLTPGTKYYWDAVVADEYGAVRTGAVQSFTVNTAGVVSSTGVTPGNQSIVTSLTPTLALPTAGSDVNGDPLTYQFRVTTGADGISGQVVSSQVFPSTSTFPLTWTVPAGVLQDGTPYTWSVVVGDGYDNSVGWVNHITVNQRVTDAGPTPIDSAGPVSVNLGNGNVSASFKPRRCRPLVGRWVCRSTTTPRRPRMRG
jgi:large repetitive protein